MSQFMLLLYDNHRELEKLSPEEMQQALEKYMAWRRKPFVGASQRLGGDAGKVLRPAGGQPQVTDGPFSESKEVLGGFYMIEAADYDEAVQRSLDHPHLEYGGNVELRKVYEV